MDDLKRLIHSDDYEKQMVGSFSNTRTVKIPKKKRLVKTPLVLNGRRIYELVEDE